MNKKTMVVGASTNPERYSYKAVSQLIARDIEVIPFGLKKGKIQGISIKNEQENFKDVHTVSLYLSREKQKQYYNYLISIKPKRIIFNPGTENDEFRRLAEKNGIQTINACTLVMLSTDQF